MDGITHVANERLRRQAAEVETRILAGENRIEVPFLPGTEDGRTVVYTAPSWRREPIRRLRIEWIRRRRSSVR